MQVTNLQNEADWAQLKDDGAEDEDREGNGDEPRGNDLLWDEFRSREQEEQQRVSPSKTPDIMHCAGFGSLQRCKRC